MDKKMFKVVIAGETRMYPEGTTYREIVDESGIHTEAQVILVMVNGKLRELQKRLKSDCTLEFVTTKDHIGFETYKRSVCLVLLRAIYDVAGRENVDKVMIHYSVGSMSSRPTRPAPTSRVTTSPATRRSSIPGARPLPRPVRARPS